MKSRGSEVALKPSNIKVLNLFLSLALFVCLFLSNPFSVFRLFCLKFILFMNRLKILSQGLSGQDVRGSQES